jgi:hypothetical protein
MHGDTHSGSLCREPAGVGKAVDRRPMSLRKLTAREIDGKPFQSAHIEIVDKLYDSHGAQ